MARITLSATPPLGGADIAIEKNRIKERHDIVIVSLAVEREGRAAAGFARALKSACRVSPPKGTLSTVAGRVRVIRSGMDQMLLLKERAKPAEAHAIQTKLSRHCHTTDQTHALVALEISGPDTLAAMERICPLDLHRDRMPDGTASRTHMEHMGATIIRLGPARFLLLSASSSARSFLHAVETSYIYVTG